MAENPTENRKKRKRFSSPRFDHKLETGSSRGMFLYVMKHVDQSDDVDSLASYIRGLIMKDLNIDVWGNPMK